VGIVKRGRRAGCERFCETRVVWTWRPETRTSTCLGMRRSGRSLSTRHQFAWTRPASVSTGDFSKCPPTLSSKLRQEMLRQQERVWRLAALVRHPTTRPDATATGGSFESIEPHTPHYSINRGCAKRQAMSLMGSKIENLELFYAGASLGDAKPSDNNPCRYRRLPTSTASHHAPTIPNSVPWFHSLSEPTQPPSSACVQRPRLRPPRCW
jgi:hypothetical protein